MSQANQVIRTPFLGHLEVATLSIDDPSNLLGPGVTTVGATPNQKFATTFNGVDAIYFASDPMAPTETCVNAAFTAGYKTVVVSSPITINNPINVPAGCLLQFMPGTYPVGNLGQIVLGIASAMICPGGRENTIFTIPSTWTRTDCFISMVGLGYGPLLEGCQIIMPQPDSTNLADYNHYNGAWIIHILAARSSVRHVKISHAWQGILLDGSLTPGVGNSGGSILEDIHICSFNMGIRIDGPQDITRLNDVHIWPFDTTANQQAAFFNAGNGGMWIGRADGLMIDSYFSIAGTALITFVSSQGPAQVFMSTCGLENIGISMGATGTTISMVGCYVGTDLLTQTAINVTAGLLQMSSCRIFNAIVPGTGGIASNAMVDVTGGGQIKFNNVKFDISRAADQQAVFASDSGTVATLLDCFFNYDPDIVYTTNIISIGPSCIVNIGDCIFPFPGTGSHTAYANSATSVVGLIHDNILNFSVPNILSGSTNLHVYNNF